MLNQTAKQSGAAIAAAVTTQIVPDENAVSWSIKVNKDGGTVGTLTITAISKGAATAETVYDSTGTPIVFNLATSTAQTYYFLNTPVDKVIITPSGLDGTYKYSFAQW